ncbi:conserved hypothetical protein [Trichinella spiralis]|uniref:hypothetical protein n=1 Tax=Trichinella spiralis TaxID=6334 RepID=UPI0001EFC1FE|nr:conserved hypothetical protein [Trichinella spiralis]
MQIDTVENSYKQWKLTISKAKQQQQQQSFYEQLNQAVNSQIAGLAGLVGQFCLLEKLKKLAIDVAICRLSTTDKSHLRCHADEPAGSGLPETKIGTKPKQIQPTDASKRIKLEKKKKAAL